MTIAARSLFVLMATSSLVLSCQQSTMTFVSTSTIRRPQPTPTPHPTGTPPPLLPVQASDLDEHLDLPPSAAATVRRAQALSELCTGPNAVGKIGDWVLDNEIIRVVIDDVQTGGGGFSLSGGQLVDFSRSSRGALDELGQVFNFLGNFPRQLRYTSASSAQNPDGSAQVVVQGLDPRTPGLVGETKYILHPGLCAVDLETTLRNTGTAPTEVGLGDAIQWAGAEHWGPGVGFGLRGEKRLPWIAGIGRHSAYAIVAEDSQELFGPNGGAWSNPMQARRTLAPGESVTYHRQIGIGPANAVGEALRCASYQQPGNAIGMRIRARDSQQNPVSGVRAILLKPDGTPWWINATGSDGVAILRAPEAGTYRVEVSANGRSVRPIGSTEFVLDGRQAESPMLEVQIGAESRLQITVTEGGQTVPARVLIEGVAPTPDPMLGPVGRGDGARNSVLLSPHAPRTVPVPAGTYRLRATRGGMYSLPETTVTVTEGSTASATLAITRVLDPSNHWFCGDFHSHQAPSLDSPVSLNDRVLAAAAEGLSVLAATDHNVTTDLRGALSEQRLERWLTVMLGNEVSTDIAVHPTGHWNVYGTDPSTRTIIGNAVDLFELTPEALIQRVRQAATAQHSSVAIQLNHPRSGAPTGMFDVFALDPQTGRSAMPGFSQAFDAIEIWNGRYQPQADNVMRDWLALLRNGAQMTGMANSDSHMIVQQEIGYPRTCFARPSATGAQTETAALGPVALHAITQTRDALMTDGPLLSITTNGRDSVVGHTVPVPRQGVRLQIHSESVAWAAADILERIHSDGTIEPVTTARVTRSNDRVTVDGTVQVLPTEPFVLFRVRGTQRIPVLVGDPALMPMALSNPVFLRRR